MAYGQLAVKRLSPNINSEKYDEVSPILSHDEKQLYFTRIGSEDFVKTLVENNADISDSPHFMDRLQTIYSEIAGRHIVRPIQSTFNQDIWVADFSEGEVTNIHHPKYPLNNALPNSMCSVYGSENSYVVLNEYGKEGGMKLGFSTVEQYGAYEFSHPEPIYIEGFEVQGGEVNFTITNDLYYVILAMEGPDSYGGKDLYYSVKTLGNQYSKPINMGPVINSAYDESAPKFSQNNRRLYFASDRPDGYGKKDIYMSVRLDYSLGAWSDPELLEAPINSEHNDSYPLMMNNGRNMIFTSDRSGTSDIYYSYYKNVQELEHKVRIVVVEERDGVLRNVGSEVFWSSDANNVYDGYFRTSTGMLDFTFENDQPIQFRAQARTRRSKTIEVLPQELLSQGVQEIIIRLEPSGKEEKIVSGQKKPKSDSPEKSLDNIQQTEDDNSFSKVYEDAETQRLQNELKHKRSVRLSNIYFERTKPTVLPSSYSSLDKLARVLNDNSDTEIIIEGHTDNVGGKAELLKLSEERGRSIEQYLIKKGVAPSQLHVIGYGGNKPITKNRNEAEKKRNRRVEIRVFKRHDS